MVSVVAPPVEKPPDEASELEEPPVLEASELEEPPELDASELVPVATLVKGEELCEPPPAELLKLPAEDSPPELSELAAWVL